MHDRKYYLIQDGSPINPDINKLFSDFLEAKDFRKDDADYYYNFVGFIIDEERTLISFPKHTFSNSILDNLHNDIPNLTKHIKLLFNTVKKITNKRETKYIGIENELNSNYPFIEFLNVYKYYKKYGIFTTEKKIRRFGYSGNISWKDTIIKSPKLINHGNLIFLPLVIKENIVEHIFVSKCMAYVINSTIERFSLFLEGDRINLNTKDVDFSNIPFVLSKLIQIRRTVFKDIHQGLLDALINFFKQHDLRGGNYQIKIYSYNLVWEDMIKEYLNANFIYMKGYEIEWSEQKQQNDFSKKLFYPSTMGKDGYRLDPDYFFVKNNIRYIFDAKYYQELKYLDYKQVSYYFLLKSLGATKDQNGLVIKTLETYNALFLPTEHNEFSEIHFELNPEYNKDEEKFVIMAYYINTLKVMKNYTTEDI